MKKTALIFFTIVAVTQLLCAKGTGDKTTKPVILRIGYNWTGSDPQAPYFEGMLSKFEEENKGAIILQREAVPGEDYRVKIKIDASSNNLPDVMTYWPGIANLKPMVDSNQLLDITEYLKLSEKTKKEDFPSSFWEFYTIEGKPFGIPVSSFKGFFLANSNLFKKFSLNIPTTWDEFIHVCEVFKKNGIIPLAMGSKGGQPSHLYFSFLAYNNTNGFEENKSMLNTWNFDTPSNRIAAEAVVALRDAGFFPADTIADGEWGPTLALYNEEKAAMIYEFPWMVGHVKDDVAAKSIFFDMPAYKGNNSKTALYTIGASNMGYVISRNSFKDILKREALIKLVDFLTSDKMFIELSKGGMPPAKNIEIDKSVLSPLFARELEYTKAQEALSQQENFFPAPSVLSIFFDGLDQLFAGSINATEFIAQIQNALNVEKPR